LGNIPKPLEANSRATETITQNQNINWLYWIVDNIPFLNALYLPKLGRQKYLVSKLWSINLKVMKQRIKRIELKGRPFNGRPSLKLKNPKTETRQRVRQLLRSLVAIGGLYLLTKSAGKVPN
jgi:hypothetical protein